MRATVTTTATAWRGKRVGGADDGEDVVDGFAVAVELDASEEESDCESLCVDALLVSSSDDDDEDEEDDAGARLSETQSIRTSSFMARSMGEASEEAVSALVRKVSYELEQSATLEVQTREQEKERGREDRYDDGEDWFEMAVEDEARLLASQQVETSKSGRAVWNVHEALEALAERAVWAKQNAEGYSGGVINLVNVDKITEAMMDTVDAGRAMCCALGAKRQAAVGTEGGFIFLQRCVDGELTVTCLKSARNFAGISVTPGVTSLAFDELGDWLLVGHQNGGLTLWDIKRNPTVLKTIVGAHRTPVVALATLPQFQPNGSVDAISSEEGGLVIHHTFSPFGMGVIRVKSTSLGERTFVIAAEPLPRVTAVSAIEITAHEQGVVVPTWGDTRSKTKNIADGAGIVALSTMNAVLIMRMSPKAEVIAKIVRPPIMENTVLPVMSWSPRCIDDVVVNDGVEKCQLVVAWGSSVYVLAVEVETSKQSLSENADSQAKRSSSTSQIVYSWSADSDDSKSAISIAWLLKDVICILSSRNILCVYTPQGELVERASTGEPPISREITSGIPAAMNCERLPYWHSGVGKHGVHVAILSSSRFRSGKFMGWYERLNAKKQFMDWIGTFSMLLQVHDGLATFWPVLSKKYIDSDVAQSHVAKVLSQIIPGFVKDSMSVRERCIDDAEYHEAIAHIVLGMLVEFDSLDKLYEPLIFDALLQSQCKRAFLEGIVPHILSDRLRSLPVEVMQALVEHYSSFDAAEVIEKCVLHLDLQSLDLNQIVRLCKRYGMYSALAYVFTRALNDFMTPMEEIFNASLHTEFEQRKPLRHLMLFMYRTLQGESFPVGGSKLAEEAMLKFHSQLMQFLLQPVSVDEFGVDIESNATISDAWKRAVRLTQESKSGLAPIRLLYLLLAEPKPICDVLTLALREWDATESEVFNRESAGSDRMMSQIVAEAAVFAAAALSEGESTVNRSNLFIFTATLVGSGRASVVRATERELLRALASAKTVTDASSREDAMVSILSRNYRDGHIDDENEILKLAKEAEFAQAEAVIYIASGDHMGAVKALSGDKSRTNAAVHFVNVLLGTSPAGFLHAEQSGAGPAAAQAERLSNADAQAFREHLLESMPDIARVSADVCAQIAVAHFPRVQSEVLSALSSDPVLQFQYLRQVLEASHASDGSVHRLSLVDLAAASESIVTPDMHELYFRLMCQFEPQDVLKYLRADHAKNLDQVECLKQCQQFGVMDAVAFLLEASHEYEEALSIHLSKYSTSIKAMAQLIESSGIKWKTSAPAEGLMKGFVLESHEALHVAIDLCARISGDVDNIEEMWWSCLDSIICSLSELSGHALESIRGTLHEHLEEILHVMLGRVDNGRLLELIVHRYGGKDISELRVLLARIFGNCALERDFLKAEGSDVKSEADDKVKTQYQIRSRAQRGSVRALL